MGLWWQLPRAAAAHSSGGQNWTQDLLPGLEEVGQVCRRELSQGAISAPVPRTLQSPRPGSPITLPTWTPSPGVGMGRATAPTLTVPLFSPEVLMSSMEEEVASARARQSVLDLFRVPVLCWRSLSLFVVQYAIPVILPGDGAGEGGGPMGKTVPYRPRGVHFWQGQAAASGGRGPGRWARGWMCRHGLERPARAGSETRDWQWLKRTRAHQHWTHPNGHTPRGLTRC